MAEPLSATIPVVRSEPRTRTALWLEAIALRHQTQSGANFDDDAGAQGKVSAEPFGKRASPGVALPAGGETGPSSASLETQWTKTGLNLAGGGCPVYTASWNWSVKTEIPVKICRSYGPACASIGCAYS